MNSRWLGVAAFGATALLTACGEHAPVPAELNGMADRAVTAPFRILQTSSGFTRVDPPEITWSTTFPQEWNVNTTTGTAIQTATLGPGRSFIKTYTWKPAPEAISGGGEVFTYGGTLTKEDPSDQMQLKIDVSFYNVLTNPDPPATAEAWSNSGTSSASVARTVGVTPRNDLPAGTTGYYRVIIAGGPTITYRYTY